MSDQDFKLEVLNALGELKAEQAETRAEVKNIVQRLDKLNGSVARHTEQIGQLQIDQARREGAEKNTDNWLTRLWPVIWAGLGAFSILVLTHAPAFLKIKP